MATCTLICPISRVVMFLLLLLEPAHAGSYPPSTERSPLADPSELPVNPEAARSAGWGELSVPDGDRGTRRPGTDSLLTSGWDSSARHQSPSQPNGGFRTRTLPHGSIVSESWTDDSQHNVAYISTTRELDPQMSSDIISLERIEMSTSSTPVTKNSQIYVSANSESEDNFETPNFFVSASNYISESENLFFTSSLEREMPSQDGKVGAGNLKRSLNTSPGASDIPSDIGLNAATVPLNTVSSRTHRYLGTKKSYSERASSISSTDSKILSILPSVSERPLNNSTRSYVQASLIEVEGLSSSQENVKALLNNLSNSFKERSTSTYITRSSIPNDSEGLNTITDFTRSLSTSLSNFQGLSSLQTDLKQSLNTPQKDSEKLSSLRNDFKRSVSTLPNDFENLSTSLDGFRQLLTSSLSDPERLSTSLNDLKQLIRTRSIDPERVSTSLIDSNQSISTQSVDLERFSTSLNDMKQSISTSSVDPEKISTSLNDSKQSISTQSVNPERFITSLNDLKQSIRTQSEDPERFSTLLNDLKQSIRTQSDPARFSTSLNDLKQSIRTQSDPARFSTSLNDLKHSINTQSEVPERFSTSLNEMKQSISTSSVDPERFSTSLNDLKQSITSFVDPERFSTSLNDLKQSIRTQSEDPERFSISLNDLKQSISTSSVDPERFSTSLNDLKQSINTQSEVPERFSTSLNDLKQSISTSSVDLERFSTSLNDLKQSINTQSEVPERFSTSLNEMKQSISTSSVDPEKISTSLNDIKQSISTSSVDAEKISTSLNDSNQSINTQSEVPERFSTSLNEMKQSISTSSVDPEKISTSLNDIKQSISTLSVDAEKISTSLNDSNQSISTQSEDPERFSTSLNDLKQSLSTSSVDPERFSTSLNDLKQSINTQSEVPERFSTSLNEMKQSISTSSVDPEKISTSLNDLKRSINTQSEDPERFSTSLNDIKQSISTSSVDAEKISTSLNDSNQSINTQSVDPERFSTSLNDLKQSLSTSPNYFETLRTSVVDFERISTSLKRSLSSLPKDPERFSTSVYAVKQTLTNRLNDVERLSTSQNYFKRSLSSSLVDPEKLTDFKSYESSSTNVFESSLSTSSNTSLNISAIPFTYAQGDSERSLGTTLNGFENQSDSEMFSTLQNVSETSLSTSQKKSKWSLSTSSNDSKRSVSSAPNDFERSLNTSPNNLLWSMNTSLDDSIIFFNTSANDTGGLSASPNSFEMFSINTQNETERHPNISIGSSGTTRNYLKSSSNTSANNSGRALSTSSNIFERSLPNTSVSSPSTVLNYSNISGISTLNNSGFTLNTLLNNSKRSLNTATNQTDGVTSPATFIPLDMNNVTNDSSEEGSFVMSSVPPIDYYTHSSSFTSHAEAITATSHLVPRITNNFLNTTFFSTINNITKFIATTLSSTRSGSQSLRNSSKELNSNFTTANSAGTDFVESKANGTQATGTTPLSGLPEQRTGPPRTILPKPTHANLSLSTVESLKEEAVRTSSPPVAATFGSNTGSYTVISQVSTDIPKPTLINITGSEFATTWSSPALLTSPLPKDKTSTVTIPTTSVIKTTEPGRTRTLATIHTWISIKTSSTTKTSTISSTQARAMIPTSTRTSDISTDFPAITVASIPTTVPPTTIGRAATESSTVIQVTTSIPQVPTAENVCISNPCLNGGTCISDRNSRKKCLCPSSWQGLNCSKDVDECLSNPCPSPAKCVNNLGSFSCKCQPGYYFEKGTGCILDCPIKEKCYDCVDVAKCQNYELNASLFYLNGYYASVVADLSEANDSISVLNMFVHSSNVTLQEVQSSVQNYIHSCQHNTGSCQIVQSQRLSYKAETLCSFTVPKCDNATAECNANSGTAECLCKDGYFKYNDMDHSCRACDDGYKLVNGTCSPCLFGFGGFNCKNPYKLITVVIAAAGGGLLVILGIALTITCRRKEKNDITKLIFKSADFQRPTYAEFPKNPRISVEWGRETIEMQENGSTKNLLQMTDIYYSSGFRGSEVDRNGLHPYSGLPGSRYSCIYTGQYNPSFSSDESRRRDYF